MYSQIDNIKLYYEDLNNPLYRRDFREDIDILNDLVFNSDDLCRKALSYWSDVEDLNPDYDILYLHEFTYSVGGAFQIVADTNCDVVTTLEALLAGFVFQQVHFRKSPIVLNSSPMQLLEYVSYDDSFDWKATKSPSDKTYDPEIMWWTGTLLAQYQWALGIDFVQWLKYFSVLDVYRLYYPLHEASFQNAVCKLQERFDNLIKKRDIRPEYLKLNKYIGR